MTITTPFTIPGRFDYIIAGGGCAGLSLAMHMIRSGKFASKQVLLVEKEGKANNDRTWCFWEKEPGLFQDIVHKEWEEVSFYSEDFRKTFSIDPYRYKMIRGIDFYNYCHSEIEKQPNFTIRREEVGEVFSDQAGTGVILAKSGVIHAEHVFNSIIFKSPSLKKNTSWLLQHFKGWMIETPDDRFDAGKATIMDFRTRQQDGPSFCYLLPVGPRKALVEYTIFSSSLLDASAYDQQLREYIKEVLQLKDYTVTDEEFGVIPMTDHQFTPRKGKVVNIGTAGGQTKGSTGYTFNFIQKQSGKLVKEFSGEEVEEEAKWRYRFYDSVLLNVLKHRRFVGDKVFSRLFSGNDVQRIFRFLDNESSISDDLKIIGSLPTIPFLKGALHRMF